MIRWFDVDSTSRGILEKYKCKIDKRIGYKNEAEKGDKIYVVIPALDPPKQLLGYVQELLKRDGLCVIVVNDGSSQEYEEIFNGLAQMAGCEVLRHEKNLGKGRALKTAASHILSKGEAGICVVCADCDGQHALGDILRMAEAITKNPGSLILGERSFGSKDVPWKSKFGNSVSSAMLYLVSRTWISDTQTGLRAFDHLVLQKMNEIPGERFEYEMQMLLFCLKQHIRVHTINIETIYENGNEGTHFRPIVDSIRIMAVLFGQIARFFLSSFGCAVADIGLFVLFEFLLYRIFSNRLLSVTTATFVSRGISAVINYQVNRQYVFRTREHGGGRYVLLCVLLMLSSSLIVSGLCYLTNLPSGLMKAFTDTTLFFISYYVQKKWVFKQGA